MTIADIEIRSEIPSDESGIRRVHERVFSRPNEAQLVARLRNTPQFHKDFSLVALFHGKVAGHLLLYPVKILRSEHESGIDTLALSPLGVEPLFQNQGIGTALVHKALERGRAMAYESVVVLGHPGYYPRFGFKPASRWHIYPPFDVQDNHFMALELIPGALSGISGTVVYPHQFDGI